MTTTPTRNTSFVDMGALPPIPRDLTRTMPPRSLSHSVGAEYFYPAPTITVQAPQSALGLHPCIALSSAAVIIMLEDHARTAKGVVVVDREK
jgi:hypothetical protein